MSMYEQQLNNEIKYRREWLHSYYKNNLANGMPDDINLSYRVAFAISLLEYMLAIYLECEAKESEGQR